MQSCILRLSVSARAGALSCSSLKPRAIIRCLLIHGRLTGKWIAQHHSGNDRSLSPEDSSVNNMTEPHE